MRSSTTSQRLRDRAVPQRRRLRSQERKPGIATGQTGSGKTRAASGDTIQVCVAFFGWSPAAQLLSGLGRAITGAQQAVYRCAVCLAACVKLRSR
ncbi:conserved hypothetical protein [Ricinus communis]|uniref:Uncharacterized protein n=1 Tax=Ricinus communis TaxID=3988 RepID=B9TGI4_RICCO|nr:conserved hypothetical protein [Ricinus communis]